MINIILTLLLLLVAILFADDWPQWRGINRDGVWNESKIIQSFEKESLDIKWRAPIGNGYSGPTVTKGFVYVTDKIEKSEEFERIHCFDAMTGEKIWSYSYPCEYKVGYPAGPRASVSVDGKYAYSLGTMGHVHCFDSRQGKIIWSKDMQTEYNIDIPIWGVAAAPLVYKELLILHIGGEDNACVIAFDKITGEEVWRALDDDASYSAPIIIEQAGAQVLVVWTGQRVVGLNPESGEMYWESQFEQSRMVHNIATPVYKNNYLFMSSFFDGSQLLKVNQDNLSIKKIWHRKGPNEKKTESLHCCISTPLIKGSFIYGVDSYGQLRCLDLLTGDRIWEDLTAVNKDRWATMHMVQNADVTWMFNEHGELIIANLQPAGFNEISRTKLIQPTTGQLSRKGQGVCWSHPAFANRHVYIRNDEEIVCADLSDGE